MDIKSGQGVTLTEILISMLLISVAFVGSATVYVTALRFFNDARARSAQVLAYLAMEHVARKVELANTALVNDGGTANNAPGADGAISGSQLKMRWDYSASGTGPTFTALNTPDNTNDDGWVKYGIVGNTLRWRWDTTSAADVTGSDPQVQTTLVVVPGSSLFKLLSTTGYGVRHVVRTTLVTSYGDPPENHTLITDSALSAMAKA